MDTRSRRMRLVLAGAVCLPASLLLAWSLRPRQPLPLAIRLSPAMVIADGFSTLTADVERPRARPALGPLEFSILRNTHAASVLRVTPAENGWSVRIRVGVLPGRIELHAASPGFLPAEAALDARLDPADSAGDGTPDFLRLENEGDQQAFRRSFTYVAEAQYFQPPSARPAEIADCAALIRYAYREALQAHDGRWAHDARLPLLASLDSVKKWQYPYTPVGPALFRVRAGPFRAADVSDGSFAQFSDARTLMRFNTHFIGRRLARALPGDLLFFAPSEGHFHSMIFLGASQIDGGRASYVLYHTGPDGSNPGEIRRLTLDELLNHPDPRWHALEGNPVFLGVYRWNILRKAV